MNRPSACRRDMLRVGSLGIGASLWPGLSAIGATSSATPVQSVLVLWMGGGVTHIDSFDPKPEAPAEIRGTLSTIDTNVPGIRFCETLPDLAKIADKFTVVRSFSHDSNDHLLSQAYTLSGRKVTMQQLTTEPNIGSVVAHLQGPRKGLPGYIAVPGLTRPGPPPWNLFVGGWLGQQYAPFCVGTPPENEDFTSKPTKTNPDPDIQENLFPPALNLLPELDLERLKRRAQLRLTLDSTVATLDKQGPAAEAEATFGGAIDLLRSAEIRAAFDPSNESDKTKEAYGKTKIGRRCLMARRLVEAGARFVMVDYGYDHDYGNLWDNHNAAGQNFPHICEMAKRPYHVRGIDRAFSGLLSDMSDRGLLASTLVVFMTEFGRTPKINAQGGRDHWGAAGSIFFAGGGARPGQVIGATDGQAAYPTTRGYTPADVAATIYQAIGIDTGTRIYDAQRRPHFVLPDGDPIEALF